MTASLICLAAGGTGGHMFPAEALARELLARGHRVVLVTDRRGKAFGEALPEVEVHRIRASSFGSGVIGKLKGAIELGLGALQARRLIAALKPDVVVGFGGYPSVPTVLMAQRAGIPTVLHEQNAVLGRANRMLAPGSARIATSFATVSAVKPSDRGKLTLTGNPVRAGVTAVRDLPYPPLEPGGELRLLVVGGSQGARVFSEIVPEALALLPEVLRRRIRIAQQCRPEDLETAKAAFATAGVDAELSSFFRDVPDRLAACHLAVCRAGASTVAELAAAGRPAVLVPYPFAMDDHQTANAQAVADAGGAWLMPQPAFTAKALADRLEALLDLPATLTKAAEAAHGRGGADAASRLADIVLGAVKGAAFPNGDRPRAGADRYSTEAAE
ncbi:UDP-diphospho-muramoylpentapeptide beta-N- acetylglucosaminyltransferase [Skermanella stibiiresistens SB22]|uniref:UDP-N-acetylglucosamine--N-acetylmuramyl-(pentapeptide) pyrophosphoryl-undecaprenol N-acetylglucosamine transferase n=1 Tax=Skermanella stibiiresistens SB22 TaxID=1385369 RepID=W9GY30_9PROT|nr:undecaprenyldiphospho-muramoylpentapeptide beta-N-acetylglucosaminyltransferase [Skermanella stibiiresistens]EWY37526.1 UDP-diphospho-muramoylpentapeptide beta-N- acetylglucosaminyltransferase [Skermanella stibiiresistens SB22]